MGDARHPLGGIGTIPKTLRDNPQTPRSPYLRPTEAAPSPHGAQGFTTPCSILANTEIQRHGEIIKTLCLCTSVLSEYLGKIAIPCHPCHLVVTRNILIFRKCCKVATVARVKNFMYARMRARNSDTPIKQYEYLICNSAYLICNSAYLIFK